MPETSPAPAECPASCHRGRFSALTHDRHWGPAVDCSVCDGAGAVTLRNATDADLFATAYVRECLERRVPAYLGDIAALAVPALLADGHTELGWAVVMLAVLDSATELVEIICRCDVCGEQNCEDETCDEQREREARQDRADARGDWARDMQRDEMAVAS